MKISEETGRMDTGLRRVAAGAGVLLTMAHVARRKIPGVVCIKVRDWPFTFQSHLVWRRDDPSPVLAAFVNSVLPGAERAALR